MTLPLTLADYEAAAAAALDEGPLGYYAGGAGDELTLRDNEAAWRRIAIRPRVLVDVAERDLRTTVLGREHPHPIFVAPTAFHRLAHAEGEAATARGAAAAQSLYCVSSLATATPAQVAAAAPEGRRWFQLYVFKDRGVSEALVQAAVEHGYEALVITVDLPVLGVRERELRSGYAIDAAELIPDVHAGTLPLTDIGLLIDASLTWEDVERFASAQRAAGAREGRAHGARTPGWPPSTARPASSSPTTAAASSTPCPAARTPCPRSSRRRPAGWTCSWTAACGAGPTCSRRSRSARTR